MPRFALMAFRAYAPKADADAGAGASAAKGSVVLVRGSSAQGSSLHVLADAFAAAGIAAYALDMRGHGASRTKGQIDHIGQLEDDLEDFMRQALPAAPATLVGFSSGGGFALRMAADRRQDLFASYLQSSTLLPWALVGLTSNGRRGKGACRPYGGVCNGNFRARRASLNCGRKRTFEKARNAPQTPRHTFAAKGLRL